MLRGLRVAAIGTVVVVALVAAALAAVLTLPAMAPPVVELGVRSAPVPITVGSVRGALRGPLVLEDVEVEHEGARARIDRVVLDWRPWSLLRRAAVVDSLHILGVTAFIPEGYPGSSRSAVAEPADPAGPPAVPELPVRVNVRELRVAIDRVELPGRGEVSGAEIGMTGSLEDFALELQLVGAGDPVERLELEATVRGAPEAYRLAASTRFESGGLPEVTARVEATGSMTGIELEAVRIETENGTADVRGGAVWYPEVSWTLDAVASLLDVAPLTPDPDAWPGSVSFHARSEGSVADTGIEASVEVVDLSGSLRGEPLSGGLAAAIDLPSVSLDHLDLRWGDVEVRGSGAVLDTADLDVFVRIPELDQLIPGAAGRIEIDATLTGEAARPEVVATLTATDVRVDSLSVRQVSGFVDVDLGTPETPIFATVRVDGFASGGAAIDSAEALVEGSRGRHEVRAGAWLPDVVVQLLANGALDLPSGDDAGGASWAGRLDSLAVSTPGAGRWSLERPSEVFASADSVSLSRSCVRQGETGACARLSRSALGAIEAALDLEALPLAAFPLTLPEGVEVTGRVDADADVSVGADGALGVMASVSASGWGTAAAGTEITRVDFGGDGLRLEIDERGARAVAGLELLPASGGAPLVVSASTELPGLASTDFRPEEQALEAELRVEADDLSFLSAFVPGIQEMGGRLELDARVAGTPARPRLIADLAAAGVRVDSVSIRQAVGSADVDLRDRDAPVRVEVRLGGGRSGATDLDSLSVLVGGPRDSHEVTVGAWLPEVAVGLRARGGLDLPGALDLPDGGSGGPSWAGTLDSLSVTPTSSGPATAEPWSLGQPSELFASADSVSLERTCLRQGAAAACVALDREGSGALEASLDVEAVPLETLPVPLPAGVTLTGRLDGRARVFVGADRTLRSTANATTSGSMTGRAGADTVRFDFGGEGLQIEIDSAGARARAGLELRPAPSGAPFLASATATLPGLASLEIDPEAQPLDGGIRIDSDDLSFLAAFLPGIEALEGRVGLDAAVSGTLATPRLRGRAALEDGRVLVPEAGLDLHGIAFSAEADPGGGINLEGGLRSGDGELRVSGHSPLEPSLDTPARVRIEGERFRAVATPEFRVDVAPALDLTFDGAVYGVEGEVAVPWARIELVEVPPAAVAPSRDVVIVDEEAVTPPRVSARVRVVVGNDVRFAGLGFTSMVEGDLVVREMPGSPPTVLGELRFVDGRYRAYGQDLEIDPGRVVFSGPVEDVGLDVTAVRTASDGTEAGLEVRGSVVTPEITLISDPAMPDADVLSYILYGKPLSDGSASEQGRVAGAAATLGANVLTTRLASEVGLDDARIEGSTREQAELVAGKYLTPSIYVSYGVGLFRPSNTFRIKYLLNSNWALQAESGDANGGDILYQIERGR
jgi:translocation and assembly module TamB